MLIGMTFNGAPPKVPARLGGGKGRMNSSLRLPPIGSPPSAAHDKADELLLQEVFSFCNDPLCVLFSELRTTEDDLLLQLQDVQTVSDMCVCPVLLFFLCAMC